MRRVFKLFLVSVLFSVASFCFADAAQEEYNELNQRILRPIYEHFKDNPFHAPGKDMSEEIINKQTEAKSQYSHSQAEKVTFPKDITAAYRQLENFHAQRRVGVDTRTKLSTPWFADGMRGSLDMKLGTCNDYADLVKAIFEFNMLNDEENHIRSKFKQAVYIRAKPGTGDHTFIIVEGHSGTMFAVDAFENRVTKLGVNFIGMFNVQSREDVELSQSQNQDLTNLFIVEGYYDALFISSTTKWLISPFFSEYRKEQFRIYNPNMEKLYKALQPQFPEWEDYSELKPFKGKKQCTGCAVS